MPGTQASVEERLEQLLQAGEFPPPPEFAARAKVRDQAVYEKAAADGRLVGGPGAAAAGLADPVQLRAR